MHFEALPKLHALEADYRNTRQEVEIPTFQRPVFTTPLRNIDSLSEGSTAHLECRLIPVGDPTLEVEWFHNNIPLKTGILNINKTLLILTILTTHFHFN